MCGSAPTGGRLVASRASRCPSGANVCLAVDASYSHDTTAVAWAWQTDDQRTGVGVHVWAAREDAPAHDYQSGGVIRMEPVKDWIIDFCAEHSVCGDRV